VLRLLAESPREQARSRDNAPRGRVSGAGRTLVVLLSR
jgi:hypothetical protein